MKKLLILIATFLLCACAEDNPTSLETDDDTRNEEELDTGAWPSSYFITDYYEVSKIIVYSNSESIYLQADGVYHTTGPFIDKPSDKALFFAELYGDTAYTGNVYPGQHPALAYPIDKITISCDKDFDDEHHAGEPLDDIVQLDYKSYYDFIKGGYKIKPEYRNNTEKLCLLNFDKITPDEATLVKVSITTTDSKAGIAEIKFSSTPDVSGEYTFSLVATINGEEMTTTFTRTFE